MAIVALFPGQGSQHVGMGKNLYENFKEAKETFEEASDAIKVNLKKLCFDGPESDLTLTENTQPCLLVTSVATFKVVQANFGFKPAATAGHSLGEYSALVATGSLPLAKAVYWVKERGASMQKAVAPGQGTMAAVMGLDDKIEALCTHATKSAIEKRKAGNSPDIKVEAIVQPANFNSPGQVVIAGSTDAVQEAIALIKTDATYSGGKAIPLSVSAPFHCKLMKPARDKMAELFSKAEKPKAPAFPYIPNRTAIMNQEAGVIFELLIEQVDHPVLWQQSVTAFLERNFTTYVEMGPGKVLTGLVKRIASKVSKEVHLHNVSDAATIDAFVKSGALK
jgi:[acyl-carrier-protein] S-malonyltransferase